MVTGAFSCGVPFHVGCLFCVGAFGVVVIKLGAYIHGVLICVAYCPDFRVAG